MHYRYTNKTLLTALLCGVASMPSVASAQQLVPEFTPFQDAAPVSDSQGSGTNAGSDGLPVRAERRGPRFDVTPYLEVQQVLVADLNGGSNEVLTYTTVAAGIDASVQTRRAEAQVNVRYERLIAYDDGIDDQDLVTGVARGSVKVTRGLSLEAGGIATRSRVDGRGPSPTNLVGNADNVTQVYSVFAGPTLDTRVGRLDVNASYRAGYTAVEAEDAGILPPGQVPFSSFDDSVSHSAVASVGQQPGPLPFGWSVSGGYDREDAEVLDQRFEAAYARADVTVPVSQTLAVTGGVGYEDIEVSERDALRDAMGAPIVGTDGRLVTDPASPRLLAFEEDGVIWDVGVLWKPSSRTSLSAYFGQRYGSETYGGSFSYQPNDRFAVNVSAYDNVTSFGSQLNDNLAGLPTSFRANRNPLSGDIGGCAFGQTGGFCFNNALQSVNNAAFRSRGISASVAGKLGGWDSGIAVGYDRRRFLTSAIGAQPELDGLVDENYYAVAYLSREIDRRSQLDLNAYANYFDPGFVGSSDVLGLGANAAYYRQIFRGLSASAALGLDSFRQEDFDTDLVGSALVGLRYSF